ncbi:unnamed protein product, partial [Scytosiphon promiscuus]
IGQGRVHLDDVAEGLVIGPKHQDNMGSRRRFLFWTRQEQLSNEMRLTIRGNRDVHDALLMLERQPHPKGIQELIEEALQIKDLGERNNVLLYAASMG